MSDTGYGIADDNRLDQREEERQARLKEERWMYKSCKHYGNVIRRYTLSGLWTHLHNDSKYCNTNQAEPKKDGMDKIG